MLYVQGLQGQIYGPNHGLNPGALGLFVLGAPSLVLAVLAVSGLDDVVAQTNGLTAIAQNQPALEPQSGNLDVIPRGSHL